MYHLFSQFLNKLGWRLNLKGYRLDDAIENIQDGHIADKKTYQNLIDDFINKETINHESIHIRQYNELFVLGFLLIYLWDWVKMK